MDIAHENIISSKPIRGIKHLEKLRLVLWNLFLITSGSLICALAINGILIPHKFLSGGFVGTTLIIHYLFPFLPVAGLYFVLNIPVYFLGWKYIGQALFYFTALPVWSFFPWPCSGNRLSFPSMIRCSPLFLPESFQVPAVALF